jgi:hypothetical protein
MKAHNWHAKLLTFLELQKTQPFVWGQNDCCLFACDCVLVMTGIDPGKKYRGKYSAELGAKKALKRYGGGTIESAFNQVFGPIKPRLNTGRGDLVLIDTDQGHAVGVMCGGSIWAVGVTGLVNLPLSSVIGCWHVKDLK